jgi:amidohydrolase
MTTKPNKALVKKAVLAEVLKHRAETLDLLAKIHACPELAFQETKAAGWLTDYLEAQGFRLERGICNLPTAFRATYGKGSPALGILAEYDALPQLGHGCGHNVIAAAAIGAGVAAKTAVDAFGGTLQVIGTPGEENKGGKIDMLAADAFSGLDVAMMVHPAKHNRVIVEALAAHGVKVEFFGKAAHASADPFTGINALNALILSFNHIDALRQHIRHKARIHGIITSGGTAPNIVPDYAAGVFLVRADNLDYFEELKRKVIKCFEGAATATGATLKLTWEDRTYLPMKNNLQLGAVFAANMEDIGRKVDTLPIGSGWGSTDMGNVSQNIPAIHATLTIYEGEAAEHSVEFREAAGSEPGRQAALDGARAMALTVTDLLADPALVEKIRWEFDNPRD